MPVSDRISVGDIDVFPHERRVLVGGRPIELTVREFDIMMKLASHPGWVFSADRLADSAEQAVEFSPESVSVHVSHLRQKLAVAGASDVVRTVRGVGYRLERTADGGDSASIAAAEAGAGSADDAAASGLEHPRSGLAARLMRDSFWRLEEAVLQIEHDGTDEQLEVARAALDEVRRTLYGLLAE